MAKRSQKNPEVVVVVGGGAAGQEAVESMRNRPDPFTGGITSLVICMGSGGGVGW